MARYAYTPAPGERSLSFALAMTEGPAPRPASRRQRRAAAVPEEVLDTRYPIVELHLVARVLGWESRRIVRFLRQRDAAWLLGGRWVSTEEVLEEVLPGMQRRLAELRSAVQGAGASEADPRQLSLAELIEAQQREQVEDEEL